MAERSELLGATRLLFIAAALVIVVVGIHQAQAVLESLLVAVFLSTLATPPVLWLQRRRVPSFVAVLVVVTATVTVLLGVGAIVGASISSFYEALPSYQARIGEQVSALHASLSARGVPGTEKILRGYLNPAAVMTMTAHLFSALGVALSNAVLIVLTMTFILLEASTFPVKLRAVLGHPRQRFPEVTKFVGDMMRYMVALLLGPEDGAAARPAVAAAASGPGTPARSPAASSDR